MSPTPMRIVRSSLDSGETRGLATLPDHIGCGLAHRVKSGEVQGLLSCGCRNTHQWGSRIIKSGDILNMSP